MAGFNQRGMGMIIFSLALLVIVGAIYNNFTTGSAFAVVPPSGNCNFASPQINCAQFPTNANNLCSGNNCQLYAPTFLNVGSPFTQILQGNIFAFAQVLSQPSQGLAPTQPFVFFPNNTATSNKIINDTGTVVFAICLNINGTAWIPGNGGFGGQNVKLQCNQIYLNSTQVPLGLSKVFGRGTPPTDSLNCTSYNAWAGFGNSYVYLGCDAKYPNPPTAKYMIVAVNATDDNQANAAGGGVDLYAQIILTDQTAGFHTSEDPNYCMLVLGRGGPFISQVTTPVTPQCRSWISGMGSVLSANTAGLFQFGIVLGFIAGIVFLILGLGLGFNITVFTSGLGMTPSSQGTKMFQTIGFGLLIFLPLYSEFGTWINNTVLGWGLDVIVTFGIIGTFFFGLYDQISSGGASSS